jgi:hypothetical protein
VRKPLPVPTLPSPDFAETAPLNEDVYLGRPGAFSAPPLRLFTCGCDRRHLQRITRNWWMRLIPGFGLFLCLRCGSRVLHPRFRQHHPYAPPPQRR